MQQIGASLWESTAPRGLAVRVSAVHMCRTHRGVRAANGRMVTNAYFGAFSEGVALAAEHDGYALHFISPLHGSLARAMGRATVARLEMNSRLQVAARQQWMRLGLFP